MLNVSIRVRLTVWGKSALKLLMDPRRPGKLRNFGGIISTSNSPTVNDCMQRSKQQGRE